MRNELCGEDRIMRRRMARAEEGREERRKRSGEISGGGPRNFPPVDSHE